MPWQNRRDPEELAHDRPQPDDESDSRKHYFGPSKFYCVETACAPCGAVIAWTKFDKSESPTKIIAFLKSTYPNPDNRPSYICIDKACQVLHTDTCWIDTDTLCKTCEQLNSWIASFNSLLKRMTIDKFNWFLHAMLFLHTKLVLERRGRMEDGQQVVVAIDPEDDEVDVEGDDTVDAS
ncbi:hypothetical protein DFP72DRAFT_990893 [Ephemerocybe angulata]|uniref:Uncharacterized protein n=1 Tax=Ephemerocybe angulata TaxID=980116 RepID=A0A8H6HUU6_9AGAR|nr:hypothetical protein DFP72DRAFT_990893 [Tulosesus angulatus]